MCGIYGFVSSTAEPGDPAQVQRTLDAMDASIVHRGPDDNGQYVDERCAMGMRRLSIIDLGGGKQPIANEDQRIWTVFNGEIYNYRDLRRSLSARGHRFATSSDTEVLVHLYEDQGEALVDSLSGMFGFAIWDKEKQELLLARDRLGQKPLYYAVTPRGLVFGSELKSLLCHADVRRDVSPLALSHYLSFGTTPSDQSILEGVHKLCPGHLLRYRRGELTVRRYWDLPRNERTIAEGDAVAEVRQLVRDAVQSHLVADVPVGAFLSGGIDSATVVGMMAELGARPKTFSIGFDEAEYNELDAARIIARKFGTDHHELVVRPNAWELASELAWFLDEPFADVSAVPTYLVSKLAAAQVKVVLSGDGGDEIFAGYTHYAWAVAEERRFGWLPALARHGLGALAGALPRSAPGKRYLRHLSLSAHERFANSASVFQAPEKLRLMSRALVAELERRRVDWTEPYRARVALLDGAPGDLVKRLGYADTMTYLPNDILTKVDRMTMAHSLEARPPLLDHTLVERVFTLPSALKLSPTGVQKHVLKRAVADLLPREILHRRKQGFGVPIVKWFRKELREPVRALLTDKRCRERGWLDPAAVRAIVDEHQGGRRDMSFAMWNLMMLELWARNFLDAARPASSTREVAHG